MRFFGRIFTLLCVALLLAGSLAAQSTTGALTGTVTTGGNPIPGATVTVSSPALQGTRTTVTGDSGAYNFPSLPPGIYTVSFELEGMQKVTRSVTVRLTETQRADASLSQSTVSEAITVTASAPSVLETSQVSTNLPAKLIEGLPIGRTIAQRIQLAPGITNSGPNNQTIINGAPSYENLYVVNGVVVNDSIRGQPENLFIEDAIQETTLLTAGVSAEYGRFTGGVVSTITKSGGNEFSGSLRDNLTNPSWTNASGFGEAKGTDHTDSSYEGTLGGYILKDRLWFFGAGRKATTTATNLTVRTNLPYDNILANKRYEGKLTGQITSKHSVVGSYLHNVTDETNNRFGNVVDLRSLSDRSLPNWLESFHYNGIITNNFLVEGQYSRRYFAFVGGGGPKDDLINGTLLRDNTTAQRMWSPTFCACDPKTRNNKDYAVKGSYFLTTKGIGSHNIVGGYDSFHENRHENNFQSGSNFRLWGDFSNPVGSDPTIYFHMDPTSGQVAYNPVASLSKTSDIATNSYFANDKWDLNPHFSFNVGVRYDKNDAKNQAKDSVAKDSLISPRFGIIYDVMGNGRNRFSANYGKYVAKVDSGIADTTSSAGSPGSIYYNYHGPEINALDAAGHVIGTPVPTPQVIQMILDYFNANGGTASYPDIDSIFVPGLTEKIDPNGITSPNMTEYTVGYGRQIGSTGYAKIDYINRDWSDFYTILRDSTTGKATAADGSQVDLGVIKNSSSGLSRKYNGVQLQAGTRFMTRFNAGINYTYSTLKGNVEGESFNNATVFVGNDQYPEYKKFANNIPSGYLNEDIRHRANAYLQWDAPMPYGHLNVGVLERYHSGQPYSALATIADRAYVTPVVAYATPPSAVDYYFSKRGAFRLDTITATDLTLNYSFPITKVNLFLRGDVINVFDEQGVEFNSTNVGPVIGTTVFTARNSQCVQASNGPTPGARCLAFNPFTDTPVEGINYRKAANFGVPTSKDAYQLPRTYRFAVGLRF